MSSTPYLFKISHRPSQGLATITRRLVYSPTPVSFEEGHPSVSMSLPHFESFLNLVQTRFGLTTTTTTTMPNGENDEEGRGWALEWIDEDGDKVVLSSDEEFQDLLNSVGNTNQAIRLSLIPSQYTKIVDLGHSTNRGSSAPSHFDLDSTRDEVSSMHDDTRSITMESDTTQVIPTENKGKAKKLDVDADVDVREEFDQIAKANVSSPNDLADWTLPDHDFGDREDDEDDDIGGSGASTPSLLDYKSTVETPGLTPSVHFEDSFNVEDPVEQPLQIAASSSIEDPPEPTLPVPPLSEALQSFIASLPIHAEALRTHFASFLSYPHPQQIPHLFQSAPFNPPIQDFFELTQSIKEEMRKSVEGVRTEAQGIREEFEKFSHKFKEDKGKFEDDVKKALAEAEKNAKEARRKAKEMARKAREQNKNSGENVPEAEKKKREDQDMASADPTPVSQSTSTAPIATAYEVPDASRPSTLSSDDYFNRRLSSHTRDLTSGFDSTLASIRASQEQQRQQTSSSTSNIPGAFPSLYSPAPTPFASTSQPLDDSTITNWGEVTPGQLSKAIAALGIEIDSVKIRLSIERAWEENRGKTLDEIVGKVLEKIL